MRSSLGAAPLRQLLRRHRLLTPLLGMGVVASVAADAATMSAPALLRHRQPEGGGGVRRRHQHQAPTPGLGSSRRGPCHGACRALVCSALIPVRRRSRPCTLRPPDRRLLPDMAPTSRRATPLLLSMEHLQGTPRRPVPPALPRPPNHGTWPLCRLLYTAPPRDLHHLAAPLTGIWTPTRRRTCPTPLDLRTRTVILRCNSTGDLYPVASSPSSALPFTGSVTTDLLHQRLGHPGVASV